MVDTPSITVPFEGIKAVNNFLIARTAAIPDDVRDQLINLVNNGSSIQDAISIAELIYARREELPPELNDIGASIAAMCANFNFNGLRDNGRGMAIASTLRAMPGVPEAVAPTADAEPVEPLSQFASTAPADALQDSETQPGS